MLNEKINLKLINDEQINEFKTMINDEQINEFKKTIISYVKLC